MLSEREDISIAEIAVYIPLILVAIFVSIRHGFVKQLGWVYLVVFCALRIAGAIMGILSAKHPTNRTDATWSSILGSIGLSPLLLCAVGLIQRVNEFLDSKRLITLVVRLIHLPAILALLLAIVGGTRLSSSDMSKHPSGETFEKAGGILFLLVYIVIFGLAVITMAKIRSLPWGERRILIAVLASLPLLAVRLLYSLLADFANNNTFNIIKGNVTVQLCMAIIEEMIVTVLFLAAGITAPPYKTLQHGQDQIPMNSKPVGYAQNPPLYQQQA